MACRHAEREEYGGSPNSQLLNPSLPARFLLSKGGFSLIDGHKQ